MRERLTLTHTVCNTFGDPDEGESDIIVPDNSGRPISDSCIDCRACRQAQKRKSGPRFEHDSNTNSSANERDSQMTRQLSEGKLVGTDDRG